MGSPANNEQVVAAVRNFWKAFCSSNPASFSDLYGAAGVLFGVEGSRPEPVRLALARRQREYFENRAQLKVDLGPIEIQWLSSNLALAVYTFSFRASNVRLAGAKGRERQIPHGRASQVFEADADGRLVILHEHLSSADIRKD